jgi:hypothetical protein
MLSTFVFWLNNRFLQFSTLRSNYFNFDVQVKAEMHTEDRDRGRLGTPDVRTP